MNKLEKANLYKYYGQTDERPRYDVKWRRKSETSKINCLPLLNDQKANKKHVK